MYFRQIAEVFRQVFCLVLFVLETEYLHIPFSLKTRKIRKPKLTISWNSPIKRGKMLHTDEIISTNYRGVLARCCLHFLLFWQNYFESLNEYIFNWSIRNSDVFMTKFSDVLMTSYKFTICAEGVHDAIFWIFFPKLA